jgi:hypothetical protein
MSKPLYSRAQHNAVDKVLARLNGDFLARSRCFFGGGTRIVLELNEYRESADIDFLCSDRDGYRELRSAIRHDSLGALASAPIELLRDVRADQYGVRTVLQIDDQPIKFEIVHEARIDLSGMPIDRLHVPCLDRACCFAEKVLANDDRGLDESVSSRDVIDIAYMIEAWGMDAFIQGVQKARVAYGGGVDATLRAAARKLKKSQAYFKKCVTSLSITDLNTLASGLGRIVALKW